MSTMNPEFAHCIYREIQKKECADTCVHGKPKNSNSVKQKIKNWSVPFVSDANSWRLCGLKVAGAHAH